MSEIDLGWADVLRRAQRRRLSPRIVAAAVAVGAVIVAAPALGVLLTRPGQPELPLDQIGGTTITSVVDPKTHQTLLEYGRWKGHDGVCYLVPHVRAGCLQTGRTSPRFISLPLLRHARAQHKRFLLMPRVGFRVLALPGGKAKIVRGR